MTASIAHLRRGVAKAAIVAVVVSMLLVAVGYGVAHQFGTPQLAYDFAMAGGLLLLAGLPGLVLAVALTGRVRGGATLGFVAGIGVRLPAGGVVALYGLNWGLAQTQAFSQIVAAAYLVFLVIEVICLSPAVKRTAASETKQTPPVAQAKTTGDEESV